MPRLHTVYNCHGQVDCSVEPFYTNPITNLMCCQSWRYTTDNATHLLFENMSSTDKHLLIVDDEPVILQILKTVFEGEPYTVTCVPTGLQAKEIIEGEGCHLLVTDKNLPDISGMDLLRIAKEVNPATEVILVTGYASVETAITAMEYNAFDYVLKPLNNVFDIRNKVRKASEKQDMQRENQRLLSDLQQQNTALESALYKTHALQNELIQSEKLAGIGTLAAGVAHEISSPLFGILGLAEAIVDEDDLSTINQHAHEIISYADTINTIVADLTGYSRLASKQQYIATVNVHDVIFDALRLVEHAVEIKGVVFDIDVPTDIAVNAGQTELQQVFVNLLKNAAEAVSEHNGIGERQVTVRTGRQSGQVWIDVQDNGPGIPTEHRSAVFDPFFTTKPPGKGTGLGLNVVYRILTKYRGSISVADSEQGTRFRILLPTHGQ